MPDPGRIESLLATVGWDKVRWDPPLLSFPIAGMELDLGGVVKEYAADRAASICREIGVPSGMVNLGGDISIIGPRPDGDTWHIGLQHPRAKGEIMRTLCLHRGGLATSGDYERCIVVEGVRYGHILNPRSGWPVRHLAAVSVVADFCVIAGSASTIALLKEEAGPARPEAEAWPSSPLGARAQVGPAALPKTCSLRRALGELSLQRCSPAHSKALRRGVHAALVLDQHLLLDVFPFDAADRQEIAEATSIPASGKVRRNAAMISSALAGLAR